MNTPVSTNATEIAAGSRYDFGSNWRRFLDQLDNDRLRDAQTTLRDFLATLEGKTFVDVGCGSGLFSLAAQRLGARVHSFDFDPRSVATTRLIKQRLAPAAENWTIEEGSVLDRDYLGKLGTFDVVYSWGVLHHTGHMYDAFKRVVPLVNPDGRLFIAIYNDQGWRSKYWRIIKQLYCGSLAARSLIVLTHVPVLFGGRFLVRLFTGRLKQNNRGMSLWYDAYDWLGGYPFEVASVAVVKAWFEQRGFRLEKVRDVGHRSGCNEFLFSRTE